MGEADEPAKAAPEAAAQDEMEHFDDLERMFHKTVQDLVSDRSLDSFRSEYEKIHAALLESHENNAVLVDKCRTLNNEILANGNKMSSAMQMSQTDQRTIAGLRHEFEKAWKLVEISQERENKSRDVIDSLKSEVAQLQRHVEQGGALAFTQESSLQEIADSIASLKREIAVQARQIQGMVTSKQAQADTKAALAALLKEYEDLSAEIEGTRSMNKEIAADTDQMHQDIVDVKAQYSAMQTALAGVEKDIKRQKSKIEKLGSVLREEERNVRSLAEDKRLNLQQIHTLQKLLEDRLAKKAKLQLDVTRYDDRFAARDEGKLKLFDAIKDIQVHIDRNQGVLAEAKAAFDAISDEKLQTRHRLTDCRNEFFRLSSMNTTEDAAVAGARRDVERRRAALHLLLTNRGTETIETRVVEGQTTVLTNEILGEKIGAHGQRRTIEVVGREIEDYQGRASGSRSNTIQVEEEVRIREKILDDLNVRLSHLYDRIKTQRSRAEAMQSERDLSCRQLEVANADNQVLLDDNKALRLAIRTLKEDIREKDRLCLETHMNARQIAIDLEEMRARRRDRG
jgi:chromosome segregation ATPase